MENNYIKLSDLYKVKGIGDKTIERIKEALLKKEKEEYISKYNSDLHLKPNDIYLGDCLELMNGIKDKSIDTILCDLPYGNTNCTWDTIIPLDKLWQQYKRIIKDNGAIVLFSSQPFTTRLINSNIEDFKYEWIWDKIKPNGHLVAKYRPMQRTESVIVFSKNRHNYYPIMIQRERPKKSKEYKRTEIMGGTKVGSSKVINYKYPQNVLVFSNASQKDKLHPTQKPVNLLEYLIKTYTNENDLVLDNCIGSGSTAVACINTNRQFIGIEKEDEYYEIAKNRVNNTINTY